MNYRPASPRRSTLSRKWIWPVAGITILVLGLIGVASYAGVTKKGEPRTVAAVGANTTESSQLSTVCPTAPSPGKSCVMTDSPGSPVTLRSCPGLPPAGDTTGDCGAIDHLADGTQVAARVFLPS